MLYYIMGIDLGGTVIKSAIYDIEGKEVEVSSLEVPLIEPHIGWEERDMNVIWQAVIDVIKDVLKKSGVKASEIAGIGLTGYGNGVCLVDAKGEAVYHAIVSSDNRCARLCEQLVEQGIQDQIYPLTYQEFWPAQTAVLLVWLKVNMPEVLEKTAYVLSIKDYIRFKLTGEPCYEITEATCNGLMNIHTMKFDPIIFKTLDISECFDKMPHYTGITDISGFVTEEAGLVTGLNSGTLVAGSCYDVNAGALANGIMDDSTLCMIAGTWSINEYLTKNLVEGANSIARSYLPEYYIMEESSPTSASNFKWFLDNVLEINKTALSKKEIYKQCNQLVESIQPQESDVIFIPYLFASATHPEAKAAFFQLTSYHKRAHMIRAIYEGVVFSSMVHVKRLMDSGCRFKEARLAGGISNSPVWSQMVCDVLQKPLIVSEASEPGALGAAICAAIAASIYPDYETAISHMVHRKKEYLPNPDLAGIYAEKLAAYEKALDMLDIYYNSMEERR